MSRLKLSLAISHYDQVADLTAGRVLADGLDLVCLSQPVEEIFYRFVNHREFDVCEMSLAKYAAIASSEGCDVTAIPVFPSRMFRQSALYVRANSDLDDASQLRGKRVGIPEWAQTAQVYVRGWLQHQVGIGLHEIDWVQAGVNEAGRKEKVVVRLPAGVRLTSTPDRSLAEMLVAGEIDAISSAHPPLGFERGDGTMRRLFADAEAVERRYYEETRIFPIMHVVAIRKAVYEAHKWVAMNLFKAFEQARVLSVARAREFTASRFPIPWAADHAERMGVLFGEDYFPFGLDRNRRTLSAFLAFAHEQGVTERPLEPEDLFAPESLGHFRI